MLSFGTKRLAGFSGTRGKQRSPTGNPLHQGLRSLICSGLETPARDVEGLYMTGWPLVAGFLDPGMRFLKRAATHSGTVFGGESDCGPFWLVSLAQAPLLMPYSRSTQEIGLVEPFGCRSGLRKTPCMGKLCIWAISSQAGPLGGALASRAQCAICL